ncbi:BstXI family restriction endonuclease [Proteus mirabilis]|uniref:BstXI family restriction endonuclease n=1 Tax=Proteus mirabilis TaxID=584 RepID=UPI00391CE147
MIGLCQKGSCRKLIGHTGKCDPWPTNCWSFLEEKDKKKLSKAGYATPRGGKKGAYQNHVYRNNKVIIPFEKINVIDTSNYEDGYIVRLYPDQAFISSGILSEINLPDGEPLVFGENACVLYRSHLSFD